MLNPGMIVTMTEPISYPICRTCGVQYSAPRADCPVCDDERQYVGWNGQQWTSLDQLRAAGHRGRIAAEGPGVTGGGTDPAIAISHPHYYGTMIEWSRAFDAPVYVHAADRGWVGRPDPAVRYWEGDTLALAGGLTLINAGVHFAGGTVLHRAAGADGPAALFSGDILQVVMDRGWVGFMYSYPNLIPERPAIIRRAVDLLEPYDFDRVYGAWWGRVVPADGKAAVPRSAERYLRYVRDEPPPGTGR